MVQAFPALSAARGGASSVCFGLGTRIADAGFEVACLVPELPEEAVAPHVHDDIHFVLVVDGAYVSSASGAPPVGAGPMLVYNPAGTMHRDRFRGEGGRFVAIGIPAEAAAEVGGLPDLPVTLQGAALRAALRAADAAAGPNPDMAGLCWELLASASPGREDRQPGWLVRARRMIDELSHESIRIATIAGEVGVHPVHLARAFRTAWGCAPSEYHAHRRVARARSMLADTRLSLVEIALSAGFGDQSHLTRAFSRRYGISPGAFRNALGNVANEQDREIAAL